MKRIGMICLALVLALGALGVAYAPWTDEVEIIQTVQTGSLEVGIRGEAEPIQTKDVAAVDVVPGEFKFEKEGEDYYASVSIDIENAYPCLTIEETFWLAIGGSIPVHLVVELQGQNKDLDPFVIIESWKVTLPDGPVIEGGPYDSFIGWGELKEALADLQLHPCEVLVVEITKKILQEIDFDDPVYDLVPTEWAWPTTGVLKCPMNESTTHTLIIKAYQYNY